MASGHEAAGDGAASLDGQAWSQGRGSIAAELVDRKRRTSEPAQPRDERTELHRLNEHQIGRGRLEERDRGTDRSGQRL
jgi:hypothetical protein